MAGAGCILEEHRKELLANEYVLSFARYAGISPETALLWILSWLRKYKDDFINRASEKNAKYKWSIFESVVENRRRQLKKHVKPTTQTFAKRFNQLHKDLPSGLQITDAILLIEHLCYELYKAYNNQGRYSSIEEFLSKGEVGLYDEIYRKLNEILTPDEYNGKYYYTVLFTNDDAPNDDIELTDKQVEMLRKVLYKTNYDTLWQLFKINAKSTLGVTIGRLDAIGTEFEQLDEYLNLLDKGETDETTQFNYEESTKEAWQLVKEFIKPMKQLSKEVRRMFSHIPLIDLNGNIQLSTFGVPRYDSPNVIHRKLSKILLGVRNEKDMIKLLKLAELGYFVTDEGKTDRKYGDRLMSYILDFVDYKTTPDEQGKIPENQFRTKLFLDMQKVGMNYRVAKIKRKGRDIWMRLTSINTASKQVGDLIWLSYRHMLSASLNTISNSYTIFDEHGKINSNFKYIKDLMLNLRVSTDVVWDEEKQNYVEYAEERTRDFFNQIGTSRQLAIVLNGLKRLGIPFDVGNISKLLKSNNRDKYLLISNLYDAFECINSRGEVGKSLLSAMVGGRWKVDKAMSLILRIANQDNMMALSAFRMSGSYMNPIKGFVEYQTGQYRGFLADLFEDIKYARRLTLDEDNIKPDGTFKVNYVHKYIEDHFLLDPLFVEYIETTDKEGNPILDENGNPRKPDYKYHRKGYPIIRNPWLDELWRASDNVDNLKSPNSFAYLFDHSQFIGSEKDSTNQGENSYNSDWKVWEDFNGMQHMSLLMNAFVQPYRDNEIKGTYKDEYAEYPTFILGDSGKLKFMRSRRYKVRDSRGEISFSGDVVMKHLKESVYQEIDFCKSAYDFLKQLVAEGKKPIPQLSTSKLMVEYPNGKKFYRIQTFSELNNMLYQKAIEKGIDFTRDLKEVADDLADILKANLETWLSLIMENRLAAFKKKCEREGILKPLTIERNISDDVTEKIDIYPLLPLGKDSGYAWIREDSEEARSKNQAELDRFLEDFYYNSTLAMISLILITTLSPVFYLDSVEMQKRMKLIHANGKRPSLEAMDEYGELYIPKDANGKSIPMRYILLNDVLGNPAQYGNKEFMDAVAYTHGRYTQEFYQYIDSHPEATELEQYEKAIKIGKKSSQYKTFAATSYTDGLGYRTLEGYRRVKGSLGEWSNEDEKCYREILKIREKHRKGTEWTISEKRKVAQMTARWQPIKPFAYGMQTITQTNEGKGRVFRVPTLIKCSECLIIPELMPTQSKLRIIGKYLDENHLDCAYYDSCIKVGAFGLAETMYTLNPDNNIETDELGYPTAESGVFKQGLKKLLKEDKELSLLSNEGLQEIFSGKNYRFASPAIHTLSYEYYVELNTVTEHVYDSRTIGTQLRKIFYDGLNKFKLDRNGRPTGELVDYSGYVDGKEITLPNGEKATLSGKEQLINFYNSLHCANVLALFEGIVEIIKNDKTLSLELLKVALKSSNEQLTKLVMYAMNKVGDNQYEFPLQLFENSMEHDAAATIISIFKKASTQLLILGGSLVQASAYGLESIKYDERTDDYVEDVLLAKCDKDGNILYYECEVPFSQEYTDKNGRKVKLKFEDWCDADGNLKKDKYGVPLLEKAFSGSTEMICYRIPSEKDYSAAVLKIKRFTKPIEGGVIKLPVQITSITGADFDIDKMFLMRPQYVQRKDATTFDEFISQQYEDNFVADVWESIYTGNYFGTNGVAIYNALIAAKNNWMHNNGISDENETDERGKKIVPNLNLFWDEAVALNPDAFIGTTEDGSLYYYIDKQEFFEAAARKVSKESLKTLVKTFNKQKQFKWYTYDYDKPVNQQERAEIKGVKTDVVVRNNMMLLLVKKRLQDPLTMVSRTTPGGFKDAEDAAENIRYTQYADASYINGDEFDWDKFEQLKEDNPDPNTSLDYSDPYTLIEFNKQNQIAAKLVGTFANLNSFKQMLNSLQDARLKRPIKMFGRTVYSLVSGVDEKRITDPLYSGDESSRNSTLYVAEMLAAAVDSVKNPTLKFLNITQSTAYVAGLMGMAGYTFREIGTFLNQPIVKEVTNYCELNNCGLDTAIKAILKEHYSDETGKPKEILSETEYAKELTEGKLLERLVGGEEKNSVENNKDNKDFMDHQFSVLSALQHLTTASLALKQYVLASKMTSANSIQSTYGSLYHVVLAAENLNNKTEKDTQITLYPYSNNNGVTNPISTDLDINNSKYMTQVLDSVFPIEQVIYDVVKEFINKTLKFFPYDNHIYKSARDFFKNANKKDAVLMPKTIDAIHRYVLNWCLLNLPNTPTLFGEGVNGAAIEVNGETYSPLLYFLTEFPKEFQKYIGANAERYPTMYRCLTVNENGKIELNFGFNRDNDKDAFTLEWRDMIEDTTMQNSNRLNVGTALYFYNFWASKFNFGATTFDHLMPQDKLADMVIGYEYDYDNRTIKPKTYKEALEQIKDNTTFHDIDDEFIIRFLIDNCNNNELVLLISNANQASYFGKEDIDITDSKVADYFESIKLRENKDESVTYPLAIHVNGRVYIAVSETGEIRNTIYKGLTLLYRPYSTELEHQGLKKNEENMPIEGTFLEPISWDKLSNVSTEDIVYDLIDRMLNTTIVDTRGDNLDILQYVDFCKALLLDIKNRGVSVDNIYVVQQSFKALTKAYEAFNSGTSLSVENRHIILQANTSIILKSFIDILCPGIKHLTGELRAELYQGITNSFVDSEGNINIEGYTIEQLKKKVIEYLQDNRVTIEENTESNMRASKVFEILQSDNGEAPILPSGNDEVAPRCRR